jgi:hypothetical protein
MTATSTVKNTKVNIVKAIPPALLKTYCLEIIVVDVMIQYPLTREVHDYYLLI